MKRLFRFPWRTRRSIESDVDAELRFHMDERTARLVATGLDRDAARAQALREFGDMDDARRYINSVDREIESNRRRRDFMGDLMQDITYAIRKLRSAPAFALTVIITLAVGIGANTTVLNLINATMLKQPPVAQPDRLAWITPVNQNGRFGTWTYPDFVDFSAAAKSWSHTSAIGNVQVTLGGTEPSRMAGLAVSGSYFDLLGVRPALGRGFLAYEDSAGSPAMPIVLSHNIWQTRLGGDPSIVGKNIQINTFPMTVVGVAGEGFNGLRIGEEADFWMPFQAITKLNLGYTRLYTANQSRWMRVIGRLAPTATLDEAQAEASVVDARLEQWITKAENRRTITLHRVNGGLDPGARARMVPVFSLVMVVPLLVLGVACANVANLFISRSVQRQRELAVRRALGASRGRLVRQLLTECTILGVMAGVAGVAVSYVLTSIIANTGQLPLDVTRTLVPDLRVFVMTLGLALIAGAVFGLVPALAATRNEITPALKNDGMLQVGKGRHRLRNAFVVGQMALSLTLLITAGLFVGSLQKALRVEPGYDPTNAITAIYDLSGQGWTAERRNQFDRVLLEQVLAMPGVATATVAEVLPLSGGSQTTNVRAEGVSREQNGENSHMASVSPGYFAAMGIPVVRGRPFGEQDNASSPAVVIINERLAAMLWPGENPIGKRIQSPRDTGLVEVIGVARNGKQRSLAEDSQLGSFWLPSTQSPIGPRGNLVVRGRTSTAEAVAAARAAFKAVDPTLPIVGVETMQSLIARTVEGQRAGAALLGVFGTIGLGLAAFGIFGVIAQGVAARTREIGIRMSLGARAGDVVRVFVREGLGLTVIGATIGIVLSLAASKILASLLFGLTATDSLTFVAASVALVGVAALASFVPARRAAKVDPLIALRSD